MKKIAFFLTIILSTAIVFMGCGKKKASLQEIRDYYEFSIKSIVQYNNDLKNAKGADDYAKAIEKFTESTEKQAVMADEMRKKYPNENFTLVPPIEIGELVEKYQVVWKQNGELQANMMQYIDNPKVVDALNKYQEAEKKLIGAEFDEKGNNGQE